MRSAISASTELAVGRAVAIAMQARNPMSVAVVVGLMDGILLIKFVSYLILVSNSPKGYSSIEYLSQHINGCTTCQSWYVSPISDETFVDALQRGEPLESEHGSTLETVQVMCAKKHFLSPLVVQCHHMYGLIELLMIGASCGDRDDFFFGD